MKLVIKVVLAVVLVLFLSIQFLPKEYNQSKKVQVNGIANVFKVPENVHAILKRSCYDCHSNNTIYPFYSGIQPMRYIMDRHVAAGKEELNFDEFATYSPRRQRSRLRAIGESLDEGSMPVASYTLMHRNAMLSKEDTQLLKYWIRLTIDGLK